MTTIENYKFQFLDGAIKSRRQLEAGEKYARFNSLMVRLKGLAGKPHCHCVICFNSLMVRLKVLIACEFSGTVRGFNSLMVRLKVKEFGYSVRVKKRFQFLDGAIKSLQGQKRYQ